MFPIENMTKLFLYITYINPLRYFLVMIRGIPERERDFTSLAADDRAFSHRHGNIFTGFFPI
jgi:hypothetical protein